VEKADYYGAQGGEAAKPADPDANEDEAWEGFALDTSIFRSGGGHREESSGDGQED